MNKPRKLALAVLASITIAGIAGASASSLGGLGSSSLGSDDAITASCDTDGMTISYDTTFIANTATPGDGANAVTAVNFARVNSNCDTLSATLTLVGASNSVIRTETTTVSWAAASGGSFSVPLTGNVSAEALQGISLVIQG
jgi:hypothetical protein